MPDLDLEQLTRVVVEIPEYRDLTPAERSEVPRIAQGLQCKDSAAAANVSPETIRARRKRIYRKLHVPGAGELIAALLARSLRMLGSSPSPSAPREAGTGPGAPSG